MKYGYLIFLFAFFQSCQVIETIEIDEDGSGEMTILQLRHEQSYMKMNPQPYLEEQGFEDRKLVFKDIMNSQANVVSNMSNKEQMLYIKYENVSINIVKNSTVKENYKRYHSTFTDINGFPDLHKSYEYYDNIVHNYALSAEEHYSDLQFFYDGKIFKRTASVINDVFYKKEMSEIALYENQLKDHTFVADYILRYKFPKRIHSVSNENAKISADRKSLEIIFSIFEAKKHPEKTNFEVVFE